jgi:hypothetical protein
MHTIVAPNGTIIIIPLMFDRWQEVARSGMKAQTGLAPRLTFYITDHLMRSSFLCGKISQVAA